MGDVFEINGTNQKKEKLELRTSLYRGTRKGPQTTVDSEEHITYKTR